MRKTHWTLVTLLALAWTQNDLDAERWSASIPVGSARALGMGGSFAALGADPANLIQNPAGLGLFMQGGLWLSPTLALPTTQTTYQQSTTSASRTYFGLNHFSLILRGGGGRTITQWGFGFGYNQEAFFFQNAKATLFNPRNSFTQSIAEAADGTPDSLLSGTPALAYQNYFNLGALGYRGIIDPISTSPPRYQGVFSQANVFQEITTQEQGRLGTWALGVGLAYQNKIFFGASLLIRNLRYNKLYRIREIDEKDRYNGQNNTTPADAVTFREKYNSEGTGLGLAIGLLTEPTDFMRVGLSFVTGSRIRVTDEYNAEMEFTLDDGRSNTSTYAEPFQYSYRFTYPYRVTAGVAFLIEGRGAVTLEGDFVDYRTAAFSASDYSYDRENEFIQNNFAATFNLRGGVEWVLTEGLFVRGGYAYYGPTRSPDARLYYPDMTQSNALTRLAQQRQYFSAGIGYASGAFFVDLAYVLGLSAQKYVPYVLRDPTYAPAPVIVVKNQTHTIVTTVGLRFGKAS